MAPKIVDKQEKRGQIIAAAIQVFGLKGFERTRMEDIAKEANIGKGTIYEYFSDKADLMKGSFDFLFTSMLAQLGPGVDPVASAREKLISFTLQTVSAMDNLGDSYRFFLEYLIFQSRTGDQPNLLEAMLVDYRKMLAEMIDEGKRRGEFRNDIDTEKAAASIAAWFDGAIFHVIILPNISIQELAEQFLDLTFNGLLSQPHKLQKRPK